MLVYRVSSIAASLLIVWGTAVSIADAQDSTCQPQCRDAHCQNFQCDNGWCHLGEDEHGWCRFIRNDCDCDNGCHHDPYHIPYWLIPDFCKEEDKIPGVKRWSCDDYYVRGQLPIGQRQKCYKGKIWPVDPRPTGPRPHAIHRFHAAHYWPYPYDIWSRNRVNSVIAQQEQNGWRDATTIFDYHFDPDTNELTDSGELHLRWVLLNAPSKHRTLFLQTSAEEGVNEMRMVAVKQVAGRLMAGQEVPDVIYRNVMSVGRPATEIDYIRRAEIQSQPEPRIRGGSSMTSGGYGTGTN